MENTERTMPVAFERGIVKEKRIAEGGYWWQYRVESLTRSGIRSLWMDCVDPWEHIKPEGDDNEGFAIGTKVNYFQFGDGRGMILGKIERVRADYDAMTRLITDVNTLKEQHETIIGKLDDLAEALATAKASIEGKVDAAKTSVEGKVSDAKTSIEGKVADAKTDIEGKVADAKAQVVTSQGVITGAVDAAKTEILHAL